MKQDAADSILKALFYGKLKPYERRAALSPERVEIESKIRTGKGFFKEILSSNDFQRLEAMEDLYTQASEDDEYLAFSHGFSMGALLMLEISACRDIGI